MGEGLHIRLLLLLLLLSLSLNHLYWEALCWEASRMELCLTSFVVLKRYLGEQFDCELVSESDCGICILVQSLIVSSTLNKILPIEGRLTGPMHQEDAPATKDCVGT